MTLRVGPVLISFPHPDHSGAKQYLAALARYL